ncbi:hypothetical protein [uncultured Lentibacter sp.]|uniref:hypothetical protein n=1 Tax=uncultured Lentibacter sp. TaxID=1659309 RepID=UPI00262D7391|nr:hypothetical protein [uncultured Lentibacter sp.]
MEPKKTKPKAKGETAREDRLKAALKANMARRKAQAKARMAAQNGDAAARKDKG